MHFYHFLFAACKVKKKDNACYCILYVMSVRRRIISVKGQMNSELCYVEDRMLALQCSPPQTFSERKYIIITHQAEVNFKNSEISAHFANQDGTLGQAF